MKKKIAILLVLIVLIQCLTMVAFADTPAKYRKVTNLTGNCLNDVIQANGQYIGVGINGGIFTSLNGLTWTQRVSGTANLLKAVTYGNSQYVAVGWYGTILTSADGITWTTQVSNTAKALNDIIFDGAQFIAVGADGITLTSTDALSWTVQNNIMTGSLNAIVYANGIYVIQGNSAIYASPDAVTWTKRNFYLANSANSITFGNGVFVLTLYDSSAIYTSTDAVTWTLKRFTNYINNVRFYNGLFYAVGYNGKIYTSADAVTWTLENTGTDMKNNTFFDIFVVDANNYIIYNAGTIYQKYIPVPTQIIAYDINARDWSAGIAYQQIKDQYGIPMLGVGMNFVVADTNIATVDATGKVTTLPYVPGNPTTTTLTITEPITGINKVVNINITATKYSATFVIKDAGNPVPGAIVTIDGQSYTSNALGKAVLSAKLKNGVYLYTVSKSGYTDINDTLTINNANQTLNINLLP